MDVWQASKCNGNKLARIAEDNKIIQNKAKEALKLTDTQMQCLIKHLKSHYP